MITGTLAVLLFAIVYWKVLPKPWRPASLFLAGMALYRAMAGSLAADLGLVVLVVLIMGATPGPGRAVAGSALAVAALALNKYGGLPSFQVVGLSYVSFRLISLCHQFEKRRQPPPSLAGALFYALFPPTFLSGPIEPYERFREARVLARLSRTELFVSLFRIATGLAKKLILAEPLRGFADGAFNPVSPAATLWAGLAAYSLFVYLDFSAYSDLAIGGARLFGYPIGENFNWPYLSASISDFWKRWHISLSEFLRDHIFIPLSGRALRMGSLARSPVLVGAMASLITMTLCGMWHGDRLSFAIWGLGHGILLATHQLYRQKLVSRLPARRRMKLLSHPAYRLSAVALTLLCVTLLWVPFRFPLEDSARVYLRLFSVFFHSMT